MPLHGLRLLAGLLPFGTPTDVAAPPPDGRDERVLLSEFVSVLAMSLRRVGPVRARPSIVLSGCNGFEMRRLDTCPVAAEVVKVETIRDRADAQFVRHSMSKTLLFTYPDHPVPSGIEMPLPYETLTLFLRLRVDSLGQ